MSEQPSIKIKGRTYTYPGSSKLGDAALIEQLTGLTHAEWRRRYRAGLEAVVSDDETFEEDSAISVGIVAMAVARENPTWSRSRVVEFVSGLDWDEVEFEPGDVGPPESEAGKETGSPNGNEHAEPSSPGSGTGSSESTTPPSSGTATSPTSAAEPLAPVT